MFGSIKTMLIAVLTLGLMSTASFAADATLEEQALKSAVARYNNLVKQVGVDNEAIKKQVVTSIYNRELARLKAEAARKWQKLRRSPEYRFGIPAVRDGLDRFNYITRNFKQYRQGNPDYVRVRRGIPFMLPDQRLSRIEYLRIYANRYAQSYNMGLRARGYGMDQRLPFYDRRLRPSYHRYY